MQWWGGEFWEDGYFVRTVGDRVTADVIRKYIRFHEARKRGVEQLDLFHGLLTLTQAVDDQREIDERDEHDIECFKPREDAPKSLEPAEQPFDLIAALIQGSIVRPGRESIVLGRHHRHIPSLHG